MTPWKTLAPFHSGDMIDSNLKSRGNVAANAELAAHNHESRVTDFLGTHHATMRRSASDQGLRGDCEARQPRTARLEAQDETTDFLRSLARESASPMHGSRDGAPTTISRRESDVISHNYVHTTPVQHSVRQHITRSHTPTRQLFTGVSQPDAPSTPRTPLSNASTPSLEPGTIMQRRTSTASSNESGPRTPEVVRRMICPFPSSDAALSNSRTGKATGVPPRLGSPVELFVPSDKVHSKTTTSVSCYSHIPLHQVSPRQSSLQKTTSPRPLQGHVPNSNTTTLIHAHGPLTVGGRKLSAPVLYLPSAAPMTSACDGSTTSRLPRSSSHGTLRSASNPGLSHQPHPSNPSNSRRSSIFGGFGALKNLKRRDSAASNSTSTSTMTWTSSSSYRTTGSTSTMNDRSEALDEVDEESDLHEEIGSFKSKSSSSAGSYPPGQATKSRSSKAMTLLGLDAEASPKRGQGDRGTASVVSELEEDGSLRQTLSDLMPFELASDTVFSISKPSSSSRTMLRQSKLRWHLGFVLLVQHPHRPESSILYKFSSPPTAKEFAIDRLELNTHSKVYVPEEEGLLSGEIGFALKVTGQSELKRDGGEDMVEDKSWVIGMQEAEQMAKWLRILKEAVLRLKQAETEQRDRGPTTVNLAGSMPSPRQSASIQNREGMMIGSGCGPEHLAFSSNEPQPPIQNRVAAPFEKREEIHAPRPVFRHPFAALSANNEDAMRNSDEGAERNADEVDPWLAPQPPLPLSPNQVALGTYHATWHSSTQNDALSALATPSRAKRLSVVPPPLPPPSGDLPLPALPTSADSSLDSKPDSKSPDAEDMMSVIKDFPNVSNEQDLVRPLPQTLKRLSVNTSTTTTSRSSCGSSLRSGLSNAPLPPPTLPPPMTALPPTPSQE
ncbi:hypothetical protein OIO90_003667 [Microbotryomycetes sp. JL221]|nr:hypothetical protein OIO90_003667 [Microbotryomycetes sp. JL221]